MPFTAVDSDAAGAELRRRGLGKRRDPFCRRSKAHPELQKRRRRETLLFLLLLAVFFFPSRTRHEDTRGERRSNQDDFQNTKHFVAPRILLSRSTVRERKQKRARRRGKRVCRSHARQRCKIISLFCSTPYTTRSILLLPKHCIL